MITEADYVAGVGQVARVLASWLETHEPPRFRFPPVPLIADLGQIGAKLALDEPTRALVALLITRVRERTGQLPTFLQLQGTLDSLNVPYELCGLADLGLAAPVA